MRRADRLFQIIQALRAGATTAAALADRLVVAERTVQPICLVQMIPA